MRGYKIKAENGLFHFEIMPMCNKYQCIGLSKCYSSKDECINAVCLFKDFVISKKINSTKSPFIRLVESVNVNHNYKQIRAEYIKDGEVIFSTRDYNGSSMKKNCETIVKTIYLNIDEFTKKDIKEHLQ